MESFDISVCNALLLFVDIIDSSVHSSMWGADKFARQVIDFQDLFSSLGTKYFKDKPSFEESVIAYCKVEARGDEGLVFLVDPEQTGNDLVHKAVRFAFELKTRMRLAHRKQLDPPPQELRVAVGIHYGEVAAVSVLKTLQGLPRRPIDSLIGYSINYAKRVESASRGGRFSRVFLSKEAADLIAYSPIALCKHEVPLKGIQSNEEVYEVRSALLSGIPLADTSGTSGVTGEEVLEYFVTGAADDDFLRDPWLRSIAISILDERRLSVRGTASEKRYFDRIQSLVWSRLSEDDPILLFWRGIQCESEGRHSRAVLHFRELVLECPQLVRARTRLITACFNLVRPRRQSSV